MREVAEMRRFSPHFARGVASEYCRISPRPSLPGVDPRACHGGLPGAAGGDAPAEDDQAAQTLNRALRYVPAVTANPRIDPYF